MCRVCGWEPQQKVSWKQPRSFGGESRLSCHSSSNQGSILGNSKPRVSAAPRNPTPSSSLLGPLHPHGIHTHIQKNKINLLKNSFKVKFGSGPERFDKNPCPQNLHPLNKPDMVEHTFNPITGEVETSGFRDSLPTKTSQIRAPSHLWETLPHKTR